MSDVELELRNAMSIDVEDYFQVSAFENHISRDNWSDLECRVERNMDQVLFLLSEKNAKATFFVLGWVAERYPELIKRLVAEGHELASHGYQHQRVTDFNPETFLEDISRTKDILENISGVEVKGYRAPSYSIGESNLWAHEVLETAGYCYSSSVYPIAHDHYGMPSAPRFRYNPIQNSPFVEIPITTWELGSKRLPVGGGGYFRLFPYFLSKWMISQLNQRERQSTIFYFHPWEIDPGQPKQIGIPLKTRFRHYVNLDRMETKLTNLLGDFSWDTMEKVFLAS